MTLHLGEGRPTKATPERIEAILGALRGGCTRQAAAGVGGVHYNTMVRWLNEHGDFRADVESAEQEAEAFFTARVVQATAENWTAAAWWLERRRHESYARRDRVDMVVELRREVERIAADSGMDPAALLAEAERIVAGSG